MITSSSAQSSPARNMHDDAPSTAIPVAISGRQIPTSRSSRSLNVNLATTISAVTSTSSSTSQQLCGANRQTTFNATHFVPPNNGQIYSNSSNRLSNTGNQGAGAIPRRNVRRGNSVTEEQNSDKS